MSELLQLEKQKKEYQKLVARKAAVNRLLNNRDFKAVILDSFCTEECARFAQLSAEPNFTAEQRADSLGLAQAAGHLRRFLDVCLQMGSQAEGQMDSLDEAIDEARSEETVGDRAEIDGAL